METTAAARLFEALSSPARLDLFRLLVRHAPDGLVAGEISRSLGIPAANLSFHLKAILHSGLATVEKEGRCLRYRAAIPLMLDLIAFLTEECCSGQPEKCRDFRRRGPVNPNLPPDVSMRTLRPISKSVNPSRKGQLKS